MKRLLWVIGSASVVMLALVSARAAVGARAACPATPPVTKILVDKDGWYRATNAAAPYSGCNLTNLHLSLDPGATQDVAFKLLPDNTTVEFYGRALDTTTTDTRTYWLTLRATPGLRISTASALGVASPPTGTFSTTIELRDRLAYYGSIVNGSANNIFGGTVQPTLDRTKSVTLPNVDTGQQASLRVDLQGYTVGSHTDDVKVNGTTVGSLSGTDLQAMTTTATVPINTLVQGSNTFTIHSTGPGPGGVCNSTSSCELPDKYILTYQHFFLADNDMLDFTLPTTEAVSVGGFSSSSIRLFNITNPQQPIELTPTIDTVNNRIGISTQPSGTRMLALVDPSSNVLTPKQVLQDSTPAGFLPVLKSTSNRADFIIIAPGAFLSAAQTLASQRTAEGLTTVIVEIQDVYDEFSNGNKDELAIRDFLQYAKNNWTATAPKYVLLLGDATFDPRNYLGYGGLDFIPTYYGYGITSFPPEAPSDDSLADFNTDGIPEMAVGRLPVTSSAQATAMVNKIVGYATNPTPQPRTALLVADNFDSGDYAFCQFSDDLAANSLPGVAVTKEYRAHQNASAPPPPPALPACEPPLGSKTDAQTKTNIINGANAGPTIVNWFGHGSQNAWRANLLRSNDAASLTNAGKLSLYLMMTCQNAYFIDPTVTSLGEALLLATNGAVAVWGSSGDTTPGGQITAANTALDELFTDSSKRLGDAMIDAKAAVFDADVRHTWNLLGDPTMKLRSSGPTAVKVASLRAVRGAKAGVEIRWRTGSEAQIAGFNLYRVVRGHMTKLNRTLIAAKRAGTVRGASYSFRDRTARRGVTYVYRLQVVSPAGTRSWEALTVVRAAD